MLPQWLSSLVGGSKKPSVLLVEDDALLAGILTTRLKEEGIGVTVENNGLNVVALATQQKPRMILLDLVIPGIDGFDVLRQLKAKNATKEIPVIVISNLGQAADMKSAKALGADEYFIKAQTELEQIVGYVKSKVTK